VKRLFKLRSKSKKTGDASLPLKLKAEQELPAGISVRVQSVSRSFDNFVALNNISFETSRGECLGIIGLNGAGKSTLLRIIAGSLKPSSGSVVTKGRVVALLELGTGFNPDYTGLENIYMNASILGIPRKTIDQKLQEIEDFAEIGEFIYKPVKTYSSGMAVRLSFAMLTQVEPDIMIIDEALSVGDAYFSHKCMNLIRNFRDQGKTFLFVSHNPAAIKTLCDRAILLENGIMTKAGSPIQVLDYYNAIIAKKDEENLNIQQQEYENRTVTRSGNGKARVEAFDILDHLNSPKRVFESGDVVKVFCSVKANVPLENPTLGFLIKDKLGNDVYGTNTHHLKFDSGLVAEGEYFNIQFETTLNLGAGEYSLSLAVHEGDRHLIESYDWFDGVIIIQVTPRADEFFSGLARLQTHASIANERLRPSRDYNYGSRISVQGEPSITRYLTRGWSIPETNYIWSDDTTTRIQLEIAESDIDRTIRFELNPFLKGLTKSQKLQIEIHEGKTYSFELTKKQILEIPLEAKFLEEPKVLNIRIDIPTASQPLAGNDSRKLGVALYFLEII